MRADVVVKLPLQSHDVRFEEIVLPCKCRCLHDSQFALAYRVHQSAHITDMLGVCVLIFVETNWISGLISDSI